MWVAVSSNMREWGSAESGESLIGALLHKRRQTLEGED
jgi:hypothetical protein